MIVSVNEDNVNEAGKIHSISWQDSHRAFCDKDFINRHNVENQIDYLLDEIRQGKDMYMLIDEYPVGIVSIKDNLIENLYVLTNEQGRGHGTKLLLFALSKCNGKATLWILDNNKKAYNLYSKYGFYKTGKSHTLSDTISEIEMTKVIISDSNDNK